jgi:hemolysin-activating ACP:hemolysin acyltransferase
MAVHANTHDRPNAKLKDLKLLVAGLNDTALVGASLIVSRHPPFVNYSFRLMLMKLIDQLKYEANITATLEGKIVAYAGWIVVNDADAQRWLKDGGELPAPNWQTGDAAIITIIVTEHKRYLLPLMRAVSHACAGKTGYAMRSYQDGRVDSKRQTIDAREQIFHHEKSSKQG